MGNGGVTGTAGTAAEGAAGNGGMASTGGSGGTTGTGGSGGASAGGSIGAAGSAGHGGGGSGGMISTGSAGSAGNGDGGRGGTMSAGGSIGAAGTAGNGGASGSGGATSTAGTTGGAGKGGAAGTGSGGSGGAAGKPDQGSLPALTVHMAGDSTMANYDSSTTQEGWGQELGQFFISKVTIDNQAQGGANIQTFYGGRWKTLINNVKAGDYVFAAFGINDSGTTHGPVSPSDFQKQMGVMADEVAAKKATFIPTTSSPLQAWSGGKETNDRLQPYCDATIALGASKSLLVDDLNARAIEYYDMIGQTAAAGLTFNGDKAHFNKAGATAMAQLASKELTRIKSPLADYLK
jgi:hypothetical protein